MTALIVTVAILAGWNVWLTHSIHCLCETNKINLDRMRIDDALVDSMRKRVRDLERADERRANQFLKEICGHE